MAPTPHSPVPGAPGAAPDGAARQRFHDAVVRRLAQLEPPAAAEWIGRHGLLAVAGDPRLDPRLRERLIPLLRQTAAKNLLLVERFGGVLDALGGIPVCALKGIHLLDTVYREDPESRVVSDLDLLVPRERIGEAVARLEMIGLAEGAVSRRIAAAAPARVLTDGKVTVDLHSRLAIKHIGRSRWQDLAPLPGRVHGWPAYVLDWETNLVYQVCHFVKHRPFSRLGWVEDVLRWIEQGIDRERAPEGALEKARRLGALTSFLAGVRVLRRAVGPLGLPAVPDLPPAAAGRLAVRLNERLVWADLAAEPPFGRATGGAGTSLGRTLSALLLADRSADRARFVRDKIAELLRR